LAHGIPHARMAIIPDAGHHANMEWPSQVLAALREALAIAAEVH
jgi:pimeloyl-ACP methyl ester carboxylesterase